MYIYFSFKVLLISILRPTNSTFYVKENFDILFIRDFSKDIHLFIINH